jgi:antibiotic biosynthesis monooxygenase (ABM) superfamily enzyme
MPNLAVFTIVATECSPDIENKFNEWYNKVHIPMLLKYKGLKKSSRYRLIGESQGQTKYVAFYEFDSEQDKNDFQKSPEFAAAIQEMQETWKDGGIEIKWSADYSLIKSWEK